MPKGLPIPAAIADLRGDARDGVLLLSFSLPGKNEDGTELHDLAGFRIMKSCGGCGGGFEPWKTISMADRRGYATRGNRLFIYDNDLREGFAYGYRVYPYTVKDSGGNGSNTFLINWKDPPGPPRDVSVAEEDSRIVLSWTAEPGMLYNIFRWEGDVYPLSPLNGSLLTVSQFSDANLENGKRYRYEVRAVRIEGGVPYEGAGTTVSAIPRDKTAPIAPTGLSLEKKGEIVVLSWVANAEKDLAGYNVYRVIAGEARKINTTVVPKSQFVDETPGPERYISYYVTAIDKSGNESDRSQEQTIIIKE
jgi:hypothetical protein